MSTRGRRSSVAKKIKPPRNSQEDSNQPFENSQNSQDSVNNKRVKSKNYSADESAAIIKCTEKLHSIININSNRDKDKQEKQLAWKGIKNDFDQYCKSQGFYVSE